MVGVEGLLHDRLTERGLWGGLELLCLGRCLEECLGLRSMAIGGGCWEAYLRGVLWSLLGLLWGLLWCGEGWGL